MTPDSRLATSDLFLTYHSSLVTCHFSFTFAMLRRTPEVQRESRALSLIRAVWSRQSDRSHRHRQTLRHEHRAQPRHFSNSRRTVDDYSRPVGLRQVNHAALHESPRTF